MFHKQLLKRRDANSFTLVGLFQDVDGKCERRAANRGRRRRRYVTSLWFAVSESSENSHVQSHCLIACNDDEHNAQSSRPLDWLWAKSFRIRLTCPGFACLRAKQELLFKSGLDLLMENTNEELPLPPVRSRSKRHEQEYQARPRRQADPFVSD